MVAPHTSRRRATPLLLAAALVTGCAGGAHKPRAATGGCAHVAQPAPHEPPHVAKPARPLSAKRTWRLVVETSCGTFTITLDPREAPHATASLVALARAHYFDDTTFHRIVAGFVIQGGDPTVTGQGGPGYTTVDPPPRGTHYTHGVVAMAKTADEPPGSGGSHFFVVTGADVGLPPDYAPIGTVSSGFDTVARIDALGSAAAGEAGTPTRPVAVRRISVSG